MEKCKIAQSLLKIASYLDSQGMYQEASTIDNVVAKIMKESSYSSGYYVPDVRMEPDVYIPTEEEFFNNYEMTSFEQVKREFGKNALVRLIQMFIEIYNDILREENEPEITMKDVSENPAEYEEILFDHWKSPEFHDLREEFFDEFGNIVAEPGVEYK